MGIEDRTSQIELKNRRSDSIPFVDSRAVKEAVRAIRDGLCTIRHRSGEIVYPYQLSPREISMVVKLLTEKDKGLGFRIGEFYSDGLTTVIPIREKGRR